MGAHSRMATRLRLLLALISATLGICSTALASHRDTRRQATPRGSVQIRLGSVELIAPPGALRPHAYVSVRRLPSAFGAASADTFAFSVSRGGLRRPATLRLPIVPGHPPGSLIVLAYKGNGRTWYTVPARVGSSGRIATAHVMHLSTWAGVDLEAYVLAQLRRELQPAAKAAASHACAHADSSVAILGAGVLQACVNAPGAKSAEELEIFNPTGTVFTIGPCTGGLRHPECLEPRLGDGYAGEGEPGDTYYVPFNATQPVSTAKYTPDTGKTIIHKLLPAFGIALGEIPAVLFPIGVCANQHGAAGAPTLRAIAIVVGCVFEADLGPELKVGDLSLKFLGDSVAETALKDAASKVLGSLTPDPGGTINLTTALPPGDASGTGTSTPVATTPPGSTGTGPTPRPIPVPTPPPTFPVYHVENTCLDGACGLHVREGPGYSNYASLGVVPDGAELQVVCQAEGETVGPSPSSGVSSSIWDKLTSGGWVSDLYVDTPGFGTWTPSIPRC